MSTHPTLCPSTSTASATFERNGRQLTVCLRGELDAASAAAVADDIGEQMRAGDEGLWLDMKALTFCDSSGIALLFRLNHQAADAGFHLTLLDPTLPVRRILAICDPTGTLPIRS